MCETILCKILLILYVTDKLVFLAILACSLKCIDSLECYNCSLVGDLNDCIDTEPCQPGESCFLNSRQTNHTPLYTLGCINNQICGAPSSVAIVGRDLSERQTQDCHECCSTDNCNKHLCEHLKPTACVDNSKADCAWLNTIFNTCQDIHHAKMVCPKFCGLCSLVDGNWADWSQWSTCDVTCSNGTQTRTRTCTNPEPAHGGLNCPGMNMEHKDCLKQLCPVNGGWSYWGQWESCSVTCDNGIQRRHRNCTNPSPARFGDHCFGDGMDDRLCMPGPCTNGGWSSWETWSPCSVTCGGGLKTQTRMCTNPRPSPAGRPCEGGSSHVASCNSNRCPTPSVIFRSNYILDTTPSVGDRLVFGNTTLNEGNGYNSTSGVFTAPVAGTYLFTVHICTFSNAAVGYVLMADTVEVHRELVKDSELHCASSDTVINLRERSQVYVECTYSGTIAQNYDFFWNTFTGSLMHL